MGTSSAFGGAGGSTPLVPSWLREPPAVPQQQVGGGGTTPASGPTVPVSDQPSGNPSSGVEPDREEANSSPPIAADTAPATSPHPLAPVPANRFTAARSNLSRFTSSGGSDRKSLNRALKSYVSKAAGGSRNAAMRMGSSRGATAKLANFLSNVQTNGVREALRSLNLENLAGKPIEEIFTGLADYICPEGGSIDEGIARDAFIETVADLADSGIVDLDALTGDQLKTVFELYATHAIEARICNDIGTKVVTLPTSVQAAEHVQTQLREFIQRSVSDALSAANVVPAALTLDRVMSFVTSVYQNAFEVLQAMAADTSR